MKIIRFHLPAMKFYVFAFLAFLPMVLILLELPPDALAGCSSYYYGCGQTTCMQVQLSTNGSNWQNDSVWIYGHPGDSIYLHVRTLLGVDSGDTYGWSFGLKHNVPSSFFTNQGEFGLVAVAPGLRVDPVTGDVQGGGPPDFTWTEERTTGYVQGIVIDRENFEGYHLDAPVTEFVTSKACYYLKFPTSCSIYEVTLQFDQDVGDPPIRTVVSQNGTSLMPCMRNIKLKIYPNTYYTPTTSFCPLEYGEGLREGGGGMLMMEIGDQAPKQTRPFSLADKNEDGAVDITDAIDILEYLFLNGERPFLVDNSMVVLQTGQIECFDNNDSNDNDITCPEETDPPQPFYGQDASYKQDASHKYGLERYYRVKDGGTPADNSDDTVLDATTGLMWLRAPDTTPRTWLSAINNINDLSIGAYSDWRMPNISESISIEDYGRFEHAISPYFILGAIDPQKRAWSSSQYMLDGTKILRWNVSEGHSDFEAQTENTRYFAFPVRGNGLASSIEEDPPPLPFTMITGGDANIDGEIDISDAVRILLHLFLDPPGLIKIPVVESPIMKTGITKCYKNDIKKLTEETCLGPDQIGGGEDGWYYDNFGLDRSFSESPDGKTVLDETTGLMWVKKPLVVTEEVSEQIWESTLNRLNWEQALYLCEKMDYAEYNDWRLPNLNELATMINYGVESIFDASNNVDDAQPRPKVYDPFEILPATWSNLDELYLDPCLEEGSRTIPFWTSTTSTRDHRHSGMFPKEQGRSQAFIVDFRKGKIHNDEICNDKNKYLHFVWPVRFAGRQ